MSFKDDSPAIFIKATKARKIADVMEPVHGSIEVNPRIHRGQLMGYSITANGVALTYDEVEAYL